MNSSSGNACIPTFVKVLGIAYYPPLILIGCCANLTIVLVMRRTQSLSNSRDKFTMLAASDTCVLLVNPMRYLVLMAADKDIRLSNPAMCVVHTFLTYFLKEAATWVLVLMSLERFLFAKWPHKSSLYYRRRPKLLLWCSTALVLLAKNSVLLVKLRLVRGQCESDDPDFRTRFFVATLTVYSLVPFLLLIVFNITLVRIISVAAARRRAMSIFTQSDARRSFLGGASGGSDRRCGTGSSSVNRLLIPVCLLHIALTLPQCTFETAEAVFKWKANSSICRAVQTSGCLMVMLASLNNGINGFAYFLSSRHFRSNLRRLFGGCRGQRCPGCCKSTGAVKGDALVELATCSRVGKLASNPNEEATN